MIADDRRQATEKLIELVREALAQDCALREQYNIGEKFRFIRDRLNALVHQVEENFAVIHNPAAAEKTLSSEEVLVYVYLYNAQGIHLQSWQKLLNARAFYEYSVNRPIYTNKAAIDAYLRQKAHQTQHAYVTVAIKKVDILNESQDGQGHALVKVKEGSLDFNNLKIFTYNQKDYFLNERGELERKEE